MRKDVAGQTLGTEICQSNQFTLRYRVYILCLIWLARQIELRPRSLQVIIYADGFIHAPP